MIALAPKRPSAGGFTRRGACPALSAPMRTGDGLLVRLNPVAGGLSPVQLIELCQEAELHGNGVVEVTSRGSVQVRGLSEDSAVRFAQAVDRLGISVRTGVPVQIGVLAGLDRDEIADPTALAESIRAGIAKLGLEARLGPKVSVVVDGGGRTALDEVAADVRLTAWRDSGAPAWLVAIAGDARTAKVLGIANGDEAACEATLALLSEIAGMGRETRARDLEAESLSAAPSSSGLSRGSTNIDGLSGMTPTAWSMLAVTDHHAADPRDKPEDDGLEGTSLIGITDLHDGHLALGVALPFGHTTAKQVKAFAETALRLGIEDIRPAPNRTLVAICGTVSEARQLQEAAKTLGFVTASDDPRTTISACPGAPDCTSGFIPARKIAAEIASGYSGLLDGSVHLHVSGCAKGCAHPGRSDLALVGGADGTGLVAEGTARDAPLSFSGYDDAGRAFASLAGLVSAQRRAGETTAHAFDRIGLSALAEAFGQGGK